MRIAGKVGLGCLVAVACLSLGACAQKAVRASTADAGGDEVDAEKVVSVNQWAHNRGATVLWINYPQKHPPVGN